QAVEEQLVARRAIRCGRRQRRTRPSRFATRCRPDDWRPPSLEGGLATTSTWVRRRCRLANNVVASCQERVTVDTQALPHPEISGAACQQGTLASYELREYLLEKWGRRCAYCHATAVALPIAPSVPTSRNGSVPASNLTLACEPWNQRNGTVTAAE